MLRNFLVVVRHSGTPDAAHALRAACQRHLRCEALSRTEALPWVQALLAEVGAGDTEDEAALLSLVTSDQIPTRAALTQFLSLLARTGPLVLILDDVRHAPDALSLAGAASGPVLVLATWEGVAEVPDSWEVVQIDPLPPSEIRALVEGMLPLTTRAVAQLVDGAEGNPQEALQRIVGHAQRGDFVATGDRYELRPGAGEPAGDLDGLWEQRIRTVLEPLPTWRTSTAPSKG